MSERRHRVELESPTGDETLEPRILGGGLELRHSAISTLDIDIPGQRGLGAFTLGEGRLWYDDELFFAGEVGAVPGPSTAETQSLTIRGPLAFIDGGELSLSVTNRAAHDVIVDVWNERTPFSPQVFTPDAGNVTYLGTGTDDDGNPKPFETSGTVLEVIQSLHERAGMRFTVQHGFGPLETPVVQSYVPGEQVRPATWTPLTDDGGLDSLIDPFANTSYANKVTVFGAKGAGDQDQRPRWTAQDREEQDRYGVYPRPDGLPIWDPELTSSLDCKEKAESVLNERTDAISLSVSLEVAPQLVLPGYHREIPSADDYLGGEALPLDKVSLPLTINEDQPTATLDFAAKDTLADKLVAVARESRRANRLL